MLFHRPFNRFILVILVLTFSSASHAALITYTDRTLFEADLDSFSVDSFSGLPTGGLTNIMRSDYTIESSRVYGCVNLAGCDSGGITGDDSYLWTYIANPVDFVFNRPVNGFGFDFENAWAQPAHPILNGEESATTSGFFGIIDDLPFNIVTLSQDSQFMWIDNITYGLNVSTYSANVSAVPVPAGIWLFGTAFIGLAGFSKRRKAV